MLVNPPLGRTSHPRSTPLPDWAKEIDATQLGPSGSSHRLASCSLRARRHERNASTCRTKSIPDSSLPHRRRAGSVCTWQRSEVRGQWYGDVRAEIGVECDPSPWKREGFNAEHSAGDLHLTLRRSAKRAPAIIRSVELWTRSIRHRDRELR